MTKTLKTWKKGRNPEVGEEGGLQRLLMLREGGEENVLWAATVQKRKKKAQGHQLKTESEADAAAFICCREDKLKLKCSGWNCCRWMGAGVETSRSSEEDSLAEVTSHSLKLT